ncbi:hypothetical protein [Mucilaginibacter sp. KACC 22063]|uniref:hypothetical protein n=1 Tax=Mucilaginibacter sp. KACC 22063 TaxID=3025666 RepID=UPI0023666396|nr:hypothetical protein [Mucilaginibacter sp. KACC 22063]WDF56092.1 hypothetical protein PQ461_03335 [Mucilaginibacter sp. KACC 22063]
MSKFKFFEDEADYQPIAPVQTVKPQIAINAKTESLANLPEEKARYRVEQMTMTRLNGIVQSHAETRREFLVTRKGTGNSLWVNVTLVENIINVYPEAFKDAIAMVSDVDLVKSDVQAQVNMQTGKILHILNHQEIIEKWKKHKAAVLDKYSFLRDPETKNNLLKFLTVCESIIVNEKNLIEDLNTKLFYDLFFDKHLVANNNAFEPYSRPFYSQLFEGETSTLDFTQQITGETADSVSLSKTGKLKPGSYNSAEIEKQYDQKYKPVVQYRFSEYDVKITEQTLLDTAGKWIETSDVNITEAVKNNVEILIDYKLRKIE